MLIIYFKNQQNVLIDTSHSKYFLLKIRKEEKIKKSLTEVRSSKAFLFE